MRFSTSLAAPVLGFSAASMAQSYYGGYEASGLYAREAFGDDLHPSILARGLEFERRDLHREFRKRDIENREALEEL